MTPWRFIVGFVAGLGAGITAFYVLFYSQLGAPTAASQWIWDVNQKKQQLAEAAGRPKLLLVGGSSVLFGLSAREIHAQTGRTTVNMGTHAALGPDYILGLARRALTSGDTVLLALEFEGYDYAARTWTGDGNDPVYLDYIVARDPDFWRSWPLPRQLWTAMYVSTSRLREGLTNRGRQIDIGGAGIYRVSNINGFGDQTGARFEDRPPGEPWLAATSRPLVRGFSGSRAGMDTIRGFIQWARAHQVRVLATFPGICYRPEYEGSNAVRTIETITRFYGAEGVPLVGDARAAMLPPDRFFDTYYHLTEEGALEHTRRVLVALSPLLEPSPTAGHPVGP